MMLLPYMPNICSEINKIVYKKKEYWPIYSGVYRNKKKVGDLIIKILDISRKFKSSNKIALNKKLKRIEYDIVDKNLSSCSINDLKRSVNCAYIIKKVGLKNYEYIYNEIKLKLFI